MGFRSVGLSAGLFVLAAFAMLGALACGTDTEIVEVEKQVVVEKEVVKEVMVPGETIIVEKEVIKEVVVEKIVEVPVAAVSYEVPVYPGKVTLMSGQWANERFNPRDGGKQGMVYVRQLHSTLLEGDETNNLIPGLAEAWKVSGDGLTWDFTIRDGVKFHNGDVMTMDDVLWTMDHYYSDEAIEKALNGVVPENGAHIAKLEATGNTLSITHVAPKAHWGFYFSMMFGDTLGGSILPEKAFERLGEEGWEKSPVGAGPFRLVNYSPSELIRFERFDEYYYQPDNGFPEDRRSQFQTLEMLLVPEESTRVAALLAGQADIVEASIATVSQIERGGGHIVFSKESSFQQTAFSSCWEDDQICSDKDVRLALAYALDMDFIRDTLYRGAEVEPGQEVMQTSGWFHVTPGSLGWSPDMRHFPFDPDKARQHLADAGYAGGEGFPDFAIWVVEASDFPFLPESARMVADMWRETLNIPVEVNVVDGGDFGARYAENRLGNSIYMTSNETRVDGGSVINCCFSEPWQFYTFTSREPAISKAGAEALAEIDPKKRGAAYNKFYRLIKDEMYVWSTGYANLPYGLSARIVQWEPVPVNPWPGAFWTIIVKDRHFNQSARANIDPIRYDQYSQPSR